MGIIVWSALVAASFAPVEGVQFSCAESGRARVDVTIGAGALHEADGAHGVAHLVEHLVFRGVDFDFKHGNGHTDFDHTHYFRTPRKTELSTVAVSMLEELATLSFTSEDLAVERNVVAKELEENGSDRFISDPRFRGTILDRPIGGTSREVRALTADDVRAFHDRHYRTGNMAVRVRGAPSCSALTRRLAPVLARFPAGAASPVPRVDREEQGPVTYGGAVFIQGFFWYTASPSERLLWIGIGEHLKATALQELRNERGLIYSPILAIRFMGPGGLIALTIDAGDQQRAVSRWFDETIAGLENEPRSGAYLASTSDAVLTWLDAHPEIEGLAAIRGEPAPRELWAKTVARVDNGQIRALLANRRRFGSEVAQANILTLVVLGVFGLGVLGALLYAGRQFMSA